MGKLPEAKDKMLKGLLTSSSAFMVSLQPQPLEADAPEGQVPYEVRINSFNISAAHLTVLTSATTQFVNKRLEFTLLDYLRLLEEEHVADLPCAATPEQNVLPFPETKGED